MRLPLFSLVLFGTLLLCPLSGPPALADTSSSSETTYFKQYGNCQVQTTVDMFTDEETHLLLCREVTLTDTTAIAVLSHPQALGVGLSKGLQFHVENRIPVAIRIDKGPLIKRDADWQPSEHAYIFDEQLARQLLHDLAHGQRVAIQVGDERGHIQLDGSRRAVEDFRQRTDLQPQQSLTIPPTQP